MPFNCPAKWMRKGTQQPTSSWNFRTLWTKRRSSNLNRNIPEEGREGRIMSKVSRIEMPSNL